MTRAACSILLVLAACIPSRSADVDRDPLSSEQATSHASLVALGDALWKQRRDATRLTAAIDAWERAVALKPSDWQTYLKLSRAAHFTSYGHLREAGDPEQLLATLERGMDYAQRGIAAWSPEAERRLATGVPVEDVVSLVEAPAIGLVFWYVTNLGSWVAKKGARAGMANKDRLFALIQRVHQVDPDHFYGAPDRFLGAFYAAAPAFAGGDLDKSRQHFEASLAIEPSFLGTYLLLAELYAPRVEDPALFDSSIQQVLEAQPCTEPPRAPCVLPELAPEAAVDKRRALALQKKKHRLF